DDNFIAGMNKSTAVTGRNNVDAVCGPLSQDDLMLLRRVDKRFEFPPGQLKRIRGQLAKVMHPTVHITIQLRVVFDNGIDDLPGLLRSRAVIEVHQWLVVYGTGKNREILPDTINIKIC